jgi:ATP-dependent DNA helicase RecG
MKFSENETLELKKSTSELKEAVISIASMLNKHGYGEVYFGIKNDGTVVGQGVSEKTIRDISQSIGENIEPKIFPEITSIQVKGKDCIYVKFSGAEKPYYAFGKAYIRVGDEDRQLSAKEIENIILKKHKNHLRWDNRVCENASLQDISAAKLKKFLETSGLEFTSIENSKIPGKLKENFLLKELAISLYQQDILSFGKARQLANMSKWEFHDELGKRKIARHYSGEDFEEDLHYVHE